MAACEKQLLQKQLEQFQSSSVSTCEGEQVYLTQICEVHVLIVYSEHEERSIWQIVEVVYDK